MNNSVEIACRDCDFQDSFPNLGRARLALDAHESEQGHDVDWQINRVEAGVAQAGADAGVCGISGCENPESPLLDHASSTDKTERRADPDGTVDDVDEELPENGVEESPHDDVEEQTAEPPVGDR